MFTPYAPRRVSHLGRRTVNGYRLKPYSIEFGDGPFDPSRFEPGLTLAAGVLPSPAVAAGRPGAGFVVMHQGRTGDYLVLGWWDYENELPLHVFVRDEAGWRPAAGGEAACVWDLRVIAHERDAYVSTVLAGHSVEAYLAFTLDGWV